MIIKNAHIEIKNLIDKGLNFEYEFDRINKNKINIAVKDDGYSSLINIISNLKQGEKIIFMLNNNSIYWNHKNYGDFIRIDSDMGSLQEWINEYK